MPIGLLAKMVRMYYNFYGVQKMERKDLFERIIDNAIEIFTCHDENGYLKFLNTSGRKELLFEEDITKIRINRLFQDEDISVLKYDGKIREMMIYRANQTCFLAEVRAIETGDCFAPYVIMIRNVSHKHALEKSIEVAKEEAVSTEKVKTEFVANVTHELRTPVNGILGNTNILLEKENDSEKIRYLNTIKHSCDAMNELINGILDFSKLEAGKFTLENRKFRFMDMIDYVKSTHMPKITEKGLEFFITVSPDIPEYVVGDELRIGQILNNLLSNACKFTHVGKVSLEALMTSREKNRIELFFIVLDTGIGIDKEDEDKLFKSFSQVDASVSRKYGGTGLGLNISKQLVDLMGGHITVDSEKNRGTMFSFSIWVESADEGDNSEKVIAYSNSYSKSISEALGNDESISNISVFGTKENISEIKNQMSKLVLCLDMENWEKAEVFADTIKQLTTEGTKEIKTTALRMKMAVQKGDYDKSINAYDKLEELISLIQS